VTVCKLLRVRSAASTPGGSDEDGGNRRAQESFDGSCGGYKCAGGEAGTPGSILEAFSNSLGLSVREFSQISEFLRTPGAKEKGSTSRTLETTPKLLKLIQSAE
jgi:hypothetical protein